MCDVTTLFTYKYGLKFIQIDNYVIFFKSIHAIKRMKSWKLQIKLKVSRKM